ncbi:MAG: lysophospholipid acyltransferase family protein [Proteobacteria bacterium]|nr:lysophospholipid acyltransferase family protein [Pseudomonadota bacterium]
MKKFGAFLRDVWKKFWRRIFTLPLVQWLAAGLMWIAVKFVGITSKTEYRNIHIFKQFIGKPMIFSFWHGRTMMLSSVASHFGYRGYAVFSQHRDGRLISKLFRLFGMRGIYGSTGRRGAVAALREGVRVLESGQLLAISPDGPMGPFMRLHDGVLHFAQRTGVPIVPVCFTCSRPWTQNRWDRYMVATPFSKIIIEALPPFYIKKEDDLEDARQRLEKIMIEQVQSLDKEFGLEVMVPGEIK